jgi:hypothetical protein
VAAKYSTLLMGASFGRVDGFDQGEAADKREKQASFLAALSQRSAMRLKRLILPIICAIRAREFRLERFPITWNHVIEKESLKINKLAHVLIEKVEQLFRDML